MSRTDGLAVSRPVNGTSHWPNGDTAARFKGVDLAHTAVRYAIRHAATLFRAVIFEAWLGWRRLSALSMPQQASASSVVAAVVDCDATRHRFMPGREPVLRMRERAAACVAMALGLAAGSPAVRGVPQGPGRAAGRRRPR